MKFIYIYILLMLFSACSTTTGDGTAVLPHDTRININFVDQDGNDLLDPDHPQAITERNTDHYYVVDGERERVFDGNLDHPKHFYIWHAEELDTNFLTLFPNHAYSNNSATSILEFSNSEMDTIKIQVKKGTAHPWVCTRVWYNGELRWKIEDEEPRFLTITKDWNSGDGS